MSIQYISNPEEAKEFLPRYRLFYATIALTFTIFTLRLWYLQIIQGSELRQFSEKNRIKQVKINSPRGLFLDRDGKIIVENRAGFEAILYPQYIEDLDGLSKSIGPIIGLEGEKFVQKVIKSKRQNGPFTPIKLKDNLSREEVFRLKRIRLETPGLDIRESTLRFYPLKENSAQLFGYVSEISKKQIPTYNELYKGQIIFEQGDIIGKTGLEETLEKNIRGTDGVQFIQVDAYGRETTNQTPNIYGEQIQDKDPVPGNNAVLTIDRDVQEAAYKSFTSNQRVGGLVAIKSNGEVLAWVSAPSFDPNEFAQGIAPNLWSQLINDPNKPLRNKVIQDHYSPGSTFKAFMAMTALEEKVISPQTIINCPGQFWFGKRPYHDHLKNGHGNITVYEALERSSNVFFYKMGISLGIEKMYDYISLLGIGSKSGVEISREVSGLMPSAAWKKATIGEEWQGGENLSVAVGQGFVQVTPMQMAIAYNAIGLEGEVYKPFVIKKIVDNDGKVIHENQPILIRDISNQQPNGVQVSKDTFKVVKEGLRRVVNGDRGTARSIRQPTFQIAGKTGTAQVMGFSADQIYAKCENRPTNQRHHGWFVGWAPADKPEITVAAIAEHSCHGASGAGPLVRDTILAYFQKYHPELFKDKKSKADATETTPHEVIEGE